MSTVWILFLILGVGPVEPSNPAAPGCLRLGVEAPTRTMISADSFCHSIGRSFDHRRRAAPWVWEGSEEFDTEEPDETWIVHLDLVTSLPVAWLMAEPPMPLPEVRRLDRLGMISASQYPLRC